MLSIRLLVSGFIYHALAVATCRSRSLFVVAAVVDHDVQYKATVVGSRASGKSQFVSMIRVRHYCRAYLMRNEPYRVVIILVALDTSQDGSFTEKHAPTIGANYCTR